MDKPLFKIIIHFANLIRENKWKINLLICALKEISMMSKDPREILF